MKTQHHQPEVRYQSAYYPKKRITSSDFDWIANHIKSIHWANIGSKIIENGFYESPPKHHQRRNAHNLLELQLTRE